MKNASPEENKFLYEVGLKKQEIKQDLEKIDKYIFDLETKYLEVTQNHGNVIKGWDQTFSTKSKISAHTLQNSLMKRAKFSTNERIFSQSSANNPFLTEVSQNSSILSILFLKFLGNLKNGQLNNSHFLKKKKKLTLKKKKVDIIKNDSQVNEQHQSKEL